jgi:predicted secreted protein
MRRAGIAAALAVAVLATAGCGGGGDTVTISGSERSVSLDTAQKLVVKMTINPGVGFEWQQAPPAGSPVLRFDGTDATTVDRPGASATRSFRFTAKRRGEVTVVFVHFFRGKRAGTRRLAVQVG